MSSCSLEVEEKKRKVLPVAGNISYGSDFYYLIYNHFDLLFLFTAIFSLIDYLSITAIEDVILLSLLVTLSGSPRPWVGIPASPGRR